jgi:hypothetical protein
MQHNATSQRVMGDEHGVWAEYAEAQRLVGEGNRLLAREIAENVRGLWSRVTRWLDAGQRRHSPPI